MCALEYLPSMLSLLLHLVSKVGFKGCFFWTAYRKVPKSNKQIILIVNINDFKF